MAPIRGFAREDDRQALDLPHAEHVEYKKNTIVQCICELRFPTLLELDSELPLPFNRALRREYPLYERAANVTVVGSDAQQQAAHSFRSKDGRWSLGLRSSSVALETKTYTTFEAFHERLRAMLAQLGDLLDTDFFTRVGLRYINALPVRLSEISGWTNPVLTAAVESGALGSPDVFWQEIRGKCASGSYSFRHGAEPGVEASRQKRYLLDFDFFAESVEAGDVGGLVRQLHDEEFQLFSWAIGERARKFMSGASDEGN